MKSASHFFKPQKKRPRIDQHPCHNEPVVPNSSAANQVVVIEINDNEDTSLNVPTVQNPMIEIDDEESSSKEDFKDEGAKAEISKSDDSKSSENKENPFACFAYDASAPVTSAKRERKWNHFSSSAKKGAIIRKTSKNLEKKKCDFVKLKDLPKEEQERITKKWHGLVDASADLEVKRFQLLVAARLHARCQEPSVKKAMGVLREAFHNDFSVEQVARADPEVLAQHITNLQFYNAKAKQIVQAAKEIKMRYSGFVPEDEQSLLQITGIGKVFADLLSFVNTRTAYAKDSEFKHVED